MKQFFSIVINHDYDRLDNQTRGVSNDLAVIPAITNEQFTNNERLWFRNQTGGLVCYIEDDESLKNETAILFFWVVCTNEAFYNYTDYPKHINFSNPFYSWSNSKERTTLQQDEHCALHPGRPPKQAIGCIAISINNLDSSEQLIFLVDFNVRKTFWEYHIMTHEDSKDKKYTITDLNFSQNEVKQKWEFEKISNENTKEIIFQSKIPLPFIKKTNIRLELEWVPNQISNLEEGQKMTLPIANHEYKIVNKDNKELTPIYIDI